jgi:hypothetical protein
MFATPEASAAATMARASSMEAPSGFSQNTGLFERKGSLGNLAVERLRRGNHHRVDGGIVHQLTPISGGARKAKRIGVALARRRGWKRRSSPNAGAAWFRTPRRRRSSHGMGLAHIASTDDADAISPFCMARAPADPLFRTCIRRLIMKTYCNRLQKRYLHIAFWSMGKFRPLARIAKNNMLITGDGLYVPRFQRG